jgi:hypothetical protein
MKRVVWILTMLACGTVPSMWGQARTSLTGGDHVEAGIFADYLGLQRPTPNINFVGFGGRAGFNVHRNVQIEGELSYDFKRNFTSVFSDGLTTQFVNTRLRTLTGLFGPKFETGSGPLRAFATFKTGFINFSTSDQNALAGFKGALGNVTSGGTSAAFYPGVGAEGFFGPFGLRLDVGDEIYFDHGTRHNLRVSFGPTVRF